MIRAIAFLLFFGVQFCWGMPTDTTKRGSKILFIGNSLTYTNSLPDIVQEIGRQDGRHLNVHAITLPNYSLEDHWNEGNAEAEIEKGGYDFVILQQGPSAMPESQVLLLEYADRFAKVSRQYHAKPALYMVWPYQSRLADLDNVIESYSKAAVKTGSLLCPAGKAWKFAWETDPAQPLYGPDYFHPSLQGSVLAAMTIYSVIAEKKNLDFLDWNQCSWKNSIDGYAFKQLKAAALRAIK